MTPEQRQIARINAARVLTDRKPRDPAKASRLRQMGDDLAVLLAEQEGPQGALGALFAEARSKAGHPKASEALSAEAMRHARYLVEAAWRERTTNPAETRERMLDAIAWLANGILALDREKAG